MCGSVDAQNGYNVLTYISRKLEMESQMRLSKQMQYEQQMQAYQANGLCANHTHSKQQYNNLVSQYKQENVSKSDFYNRTVSPNETGIEYLKRSHKEFTCDAITVK